MMGSMSGMVDTMEKLNEGLNIKIIDISKEDTPENTQTKICLSANYGPVHGKNRGGIDGVCYEGATASMTIAEFLNEEALDECFRTVTLRFVAEGQEDVVLTVDLGKDLPLAKIPQLDVGEHELYQWELRPNVTSEVLGMGETAQVQYISGERLSKILFDQTYEAVYDAKNMVVASEEKTESGRALALAVGAFDRDAALRLTNITGQESSVGGVAVQENWEVTMADAGIEKLHYHIPEGTDAENIVLYVKDSSGNWAQRGFTVEGSYMIFSFTQGESGFALEVLPGETFPAAAVGMTAGAVLLPLIAGMVLRKQRAKKKGTAGEKN